MNKNVIPNTTGAIAFIRKADDVKPYIAAAKVIAWELEDTSDLSRCRSMLECEPVFTFDYIGENDMLVAVYHPDTKTMDSIDLCTSLTFDSPRAYDEVVMYLENYYHLEVAN